MVLDTVVSEVPNFTKKSSAAMEAICTALEVGNCHSLAVVLSSA